MDAYKFKENFEGIEKIISNINDLKIKSISTDYKKSDMIGFINIENNGVSRTLIESEIRKFYENKEFDIKYIEGSYWINNKDEKYIISVNTKSNQIILAKL
jgi:hypothetical protein